MLYLLGTLIVVTVTILTTTILNKIIMLKPSLSRKRNFNANNNNNTQDEENLFFDLENVDKKHFTQTGYILIIKNYLDLA